MKNLVLSASVASLFLASLTACGGGGGGGTVAIGTLLVEVALGPPPPPPHAVKLAKNKDATLADKTRFFI